MSLIQEMINYLNNPCKSLSIPYWKHKSIKIPSNIEIIHMDRFCDQYEKYQRYFRICHRLMDIKEVYNTVCSINLKYAKEALIKMMNECYTHENISIHESDVELKEGIIEWVQVLPAYRNKGYGTDIVNYLLKQLKELGASFVTVSGSLENKTNPERLYRKCGFIGDDVWYICKK